LSSRISVIGAQALMKNVTYCENAYDCAEAADALVIATEWEQFRRRGTSL
jgi:UDPglucose 6-dehydrogenase